MSIHAFIVEMDDPDGAGADSTWVIKCTECGGEIYDKDIAWYDSEIASAVYCIDCVEGD